MGDVLNSGLRVSLRAAACMLAGDARDPAVLHGDVVHAVEPRGWIHHGAALEQEIVHVTLPMNAGSR
jgi:hypothetical protein